MTDTIQTSSAPPIDDTRARNKAIVFAALAEAGIETLTLGFDGCGDSGQIDDIEAWLPGPEKIRFPSNRKVQLASPIEGDPPAEMTLQEAIETLVYDYLDETHYGWEDSDGAFGAFVFLVPDRTITLKFNERFTDFRTHSEEF